MSDSMLRCAQVASPIGTLRLIADDDGLVAVLWPQDPPSRVPGVERPTVIDPAGHPVLRSAATQLDEYFAGCRHEFDLPLAPRGTRFQLAAWAGLREIPYGETRTYAQQAAMIGSPRAVRAVGAANGRNPLSIIVPCHRVVGADGALRGFAAGVSTKAWLLDHERRHRPSGTGAPTVHR